MGVENGKLVASMHGIPAEAIVAELDLVLFEKTESGHYIQHLMRDRNS